VVGRHSGSVSGFKYPREVVPGTIMAHAGLKNEKQRQDLVAYLSRR
jgi:cytochrome c2